MSEEKKRVLIIMTANVRYPKDGKTYILAEGSKVDCDVEVAKELKDSEAAVDFSDREQKVIKIP